MNMPITSVHAGGLAGLIARLGGAALVLGLLIAATQSSMGQEKTDPYNFDIPKIEGVANPANGTGIMVSGELWDSFMPENKGPFYSEASRDMLFAFVRLGNYDRAWTSPTHMWPGGWDRGAFWGKELVAMVWDPDPNFNPSSIGGATNPSFASDPNYAFLSYPNPGRTKTIPGKGDPNRDFNIETKWVDAQKRHHALYQAGWPTNVGVDVKMNIHQYSLNWNNFNDFIIVEVTLTNTGVVDMNGDGTPEVTNHVIEGLTMIAHGEYMSSYSLSRAAGRGNRFGATRAVGYVADNDASGAPWAIHVSYPGESTTGAKDMGLFDYNSGYYSETYSAWTWLGAKDASGNDFPTVFGTHPIGTGAQRGWFLSDGTGKGQSLSSPPGNAKNFFVASMGTFFQDGGKQYDAAKYDLAPNANFFASGTAGDIRTFVPKASPSQPNGDRKSTDVFEVNTYEPGWTKGFTAANNFDGDGFQGIGPFKLAVGQSVTITWAEAGGYRLDGVENAIGTARWVFENKTNANYDLPFDYPAVPKMRVDNTLNTSVRVRWDNRADSGPGFAGYKVYKVGLANTFNYQALGMRGLDEYWRNDTPGPTPASLLKPVNPQFSGTAKDGVPDSWGPYQLIAIIPAASLSQYADNSSAGYNYSYEDPVVDLAFKYWYYVAAYSNQNVTLNNYVSASNSASTTRLETSNVNRNGSEGLWVATYPFADQNPQYPQTIDGQEQIGAGFVVKSRLAAESALASGAAKISVRPNPYKQKGLSDSAVDPFDHKITFYNLPSRATITILDVSGQLIDEFVFTSSDPNAGSTTWDMFSKDGSEIASGLYIYYVQYSGGTQLGYFSVLR